MKNWILAAAVWLRATARYCSGTATERDCLDTLAAAALREAQPELMMRRLAAAREFAARTGLPAEFAFDPQVNSVTLFRTLF